MTEGRVLLEGGRGSFVAYGDFLFRYRNLVFPLYMIALLFGFPPVPAGGEALTDAWLDLAGLSIVLSGSALRIAVVGLAYIKRGGVDKKVFADELVTAGIFAHGRNPLYLANLLVLLGFFVIHNNPLVYLLGGAFFLVSYGAIVAAEERYLSAKFGSAYDDYRHRVPRWMIDPRGLRKTFRSMTFNWGRVVAKEYSSFSTMIVTLLGLFAYQTAVVTGLAESRDVLLTYAAAVVFCGVATLWVRALKKAGRFR